MLGVAASTLASLPWGGQALGLGLLGLAALEVVALAVVPSLPSFRAWAEHRTRQENRRQWRQSLFDEIALHGGSSHLQNFIQMEQRIASLYRVVQDAAASLSRQEVEQLEDTSLDYLRLCLSDAVMRDSERAGLDLGAAVKAKLQAVQEQLSSVDLSSQEAQHLRRAQSDFQEVVAREGRMASRRAMLDASLVSMPARMEEVYQLVMTSPRNGNLGDLLEESLSKLRITEEVSMALDQDLGLARSAGVLTSSAMRSPQRPSVAAAQKT